jgi:hypothetical protein
MIGKTFQLKEGKTLIFLKRKPPVFGCLSVTGNQRGEKSLV